MHAYDCLSIPALRVMLRCQCCDCAAGIMLCDAAPALRDDRRRGAYRARIVSVSSAASVAIKTSAPRASTTSSRKAGAVQFAARICPWRHTATARCPKGGQEGGGGGTQTLGGPTVTSLIVSPSTSGPKLTAIPLRLASRSNSESDTRVKVKGL
jgi:hypothetical protein